MIGLASGLSNYCGIVLSVSLRSLKRSVAIKYTSGVDVNPIIVL